MTETERIVDQLRRAFDGDAWFGPGLRGLLNSVTLRQAAARPVPTAHSVYELVHHIATWEEVALRRLQGEPCSPSDAEDFPSKTPVGESDWRQCLERLYRTHDVLLASIASLDPARLDERAAGENYTNYFMLHGAVQHDVYHTGQIGLLLKK